MRIIKQNSISFALAYWPVFFCCFILFSCQDNSGLEAAISSNNVRLSFDRFDLAYKNASSNNLDSLKAAYPFFFPSQTPDSIWKLKLEDPLQKELLSEVGMAFPNLEPFKDSISHLYEHLVYYFPLQKQPVVYTLTNEVEHAYRVVATDSIWLVALDNYLGPTHKFYQTFPQYQRAEKDSKYLLVDLAASLAENQTPGPQQPYFLSKMVYEGKKLLLQELLWPHAAEAHHLHYSPQQFEWAVKNEAQIWRHFIENEVLYHTQKDLEYRFLYPAPFTKFNLDIDRESPPRLGQFIGLQLVRSYYNSHGASLEKLLRTDAVTLLREAAYKPKK